MPKRKPTVSPRTRTGSSRGATAAAACTRSTGGGGDDDDDDVIMVDDGNEESDGGGGAQDDVEQSQDDDVVCLDPPPHKQPRRNAAADQPAEFMFHASMQAVRSADVGARMHFVVAPQHDAVYLFHSMGDRQRVGYLSGALVPAITEMFADEHHLVVSAVVASRDSLPPQYVESNACSTAFSARVIGSTTSCIRAMRHLNACGTLIITTDTRLRAALDVMEQQQQHSQRRVQPPPKTSRSTTATATGATATPTISASRTYLMGFPYKMRLLRQTPAPSDVLPFILQYDRRRPENSVISISSMERVPMGHVDRRLTRVMASLMYANDVRLVATVLARDGHSSIPCLDTECPLSVRVYGHPSLSRTVHDALTSVGVQVVIESSLDRLAQHPSRSPLSNSPASSSTNSPAGTVDASATSAGSAAGPYGSNGGATDHTRHLPASITSTTTTTTEAPSGTSQTVYNNGQIPTVVDSMIQTARDLATMPKATQPDRLRTSLLPYQRQGLQWLLDREHPPLPTLDTPQFFWSFRPTQYVNTTTGNVYHNSLTDAEVILPPRLPRGGILADDMGLGKTIQFIGLMVSDPSGTGLVAQPRPPVHGTVRTTLVVCPLSVVSTWVEQIRQHVVPERFLRQFVFHGTSRTSCSINDLTSYDVVITTYQIVSSEHALYLEDLAAENAGGTGASGCASGTATSTAGAKASVSGRGSPNGAVGARNKRGHRSLLHRIRWLRVILDEGHAIKSRQTKQSIAACALDADRYWVTTGTPIQNRLDDLYALVKFLHAQPLDNRDEFTRLIARPLTSNVESTRQAAMHRLQGLVTFLCLRRHKSTEILGQKILTLPEKHISIEWLDMLEDERKLYVYMRERSKNVISSFLEQGTLLQNYVHVLEQFMRLRQLCDHPMLAARHVTQHDLQVINSGGGDDVTESMAKSMTCNSDRTATATTGASAASASTTVASPVDVARTLLRASESLDCVVCSEPIRKPMITPCGHFFCLRCVQRVLPSSRQCPLCSLPVVMDQLVSPFDDTSRPIEVLDDDDDDDDDDGDVMLVAPAKAVTTVTGAAAESASASVSQTSTTVAAPARALGGGREFKMSTKMQFLVHLLETTRAEDATVKTVVFSQWTKMLDLVERPLVARRIGFRRLDGSMRREKREEAMRDFAREKGVQVLLVSLRCGGLGLNLTMAQQVVLLDPWFNPSVEDQAIDRVYRLGQPRPVRVYRLFMRNSIEETIYRMQEDKRKLMRDALNDPRGRNEAEAREDRKKDFRMLIEGGLGIGGDEAKEGQSVKRRNVEGAQETEEKERKRRRVPMTATAIGVGQGMGETDGRAGGGGEGRARKKRSRKL